MPMTNDERVAELEAIVRQLVIEWDAPNASTSLKFLEAIRRARKAVGLALASPDDDVAEAALLQAHGYEI